MYNAFWRHAFFVRGHSFSVKIFDRSHSGCQVIRLGAGDVFRGPSGHVLPLPSRVSLSRARSFLRTLLPSTCYAGKCKVAYWTWCCYGNREYVKFSGICSILWSGLLPSLPDKQKNRVKFWDASEGFTFSEKTVTLNHMSVIGRFDWLSVRIGKTSVRLNRACSFIIRTTFWDKLPWNTAEIRVWNMNQGLSVLAFLLCFS